MDNFGYALVVLVVVGVAIALATVRSAVAGSTWSLADALSEEVTVNALDGGKPVLNTQGTEAIKITMLKASSSRLIALFGLIVMMMIYVGFGCVILFDLATGAPLPSLNDAIVPFLLAGASMFAPYAVNKITSVFAPPANDK